MRPRAAATARLAAWTGGLAAAARVLAATGPGPLGLPVGGLDDLEGWVAGATPVDLVLAVLRLGAVAATWYLLAATVLAALARAVRVRPVTAAVERLAPDLVRRLATGGSSIGLAVGGAVASLPVPGLPVRPEPVTVAAAPAAPSATLARIEPAPDPALPARASATMTRTGTTAGPAAPDHRSGARRPPGVPPPSATMTRVEVPPPSGPPSVTADHSPVPGATTPAATGTADTWVVDPGDSFWSIAEDVVGREAGDRAIGRYWRALVDANRGRLVDPANPDLLVPGQELITPPPA
ncbi:MAG TPA: LysM domain-containing protein [Acidimicrobiales bacterium]|nr:LysM domain-containing protein [Acidimicrobiales bacterium]